MNVPSSPKKIGNIQFGLLGPQEIRSMSATKIITADTYDDDGFPIEMGLMDPRLGVIEPGLRCKTCGNTVGDCPGHFGHIDLAMPVIHVGYNWMIRNLLRSTCRNCGRILATESEIEEYRQELNEWREQNRDEWELIKKTIKKETRPSSGDECVHCGEPQRKVDMDKPTTYREEGHKLTPVDIREWLERVRPEEAELLGLNPDVAKPEWMVLTVLPVPPVTMRPSITLESGERSEDDLTHKLVDVLRINQRLQENRDAGAPQLIVEDLWELLQYHITTCIDNESSGIPPARHRSGRPLKTLSQRLKGKEGRFRGSLSGKRVNFSARTVISPDPTLSLNEVGVPERVATEMTQTMNVNERNLQKARRYVANGPEAHPGANYVRRHDGRRLKVTEKNCEELAEKVEPGWEVSRHLIDGDIVIFNRQPSLHRMSIMAHEVVVMPYKTFRLNTTVCPPYNADFDGDEMNMHALQNEEARAEARVLMRVQEQMLSPRFGENIIGAIQDHVTALYLLTNDDPTFTETQALDLLRETGVDELPAPDGEVDGEAYWTGRSIFSELLPDTLSLEFGSSAGDTVRIEDGELTEGTIDEDAVGAFGGEIVDTITKTYGKTRARVFVNEASSVAVRTIMHFGFSIGIDDESIPPAADEQVDEAIDDAYERIEELIDSYEAGELESLPGRTVDETLEMKIMQTLGKARDNAGEIAEQSFDDDNPAVIMAESGARGSMLNLTQMAGCVGQQAVRGERINRGYENRTLSHFEEDDLSAEAHGFVKHSYREGLEPKEFFFHAMGGREGLVDTAVRTSKSGYLQRRLINALSELETQYDGTVRDTSDTIVQFEFGEDGTSPVEVSSSQEGPAVDVENIADRILEEEFDDESEKERFMGDRPEPTNLSEHTDESWLEKTTAQGDARSDD